MKKTKFALIGAAGYIAPRHMKAIKDTGNCLVAALDKNDSVGIIDSYFPDAHFFTEFEQFDRFIDKYYRENEHRIEYISIATPNYLHDCHIRFALKSHAHAICEKPLVLKPQDITQLKVIENETGNKVYNILQLRLHKSIIELKAKVAAELAQNPDKVYDVDLTYLTRRGKWYFCSWKGEENKSGGVASNIGVHFFDMLTYIFGEVKENIVHLKHDDTNSGFLRLAHANVRWFLSVNYDYIPENIKAAGQTTYRCITVDGDEFEFSEGFTELHTRSYEEILHGRGFGLDEAYGSINTTYTIQMSEPLGLKGDYHPFCRQVLK